MEGGILTSSKGGKIYIWINVSCNYWGMSTSFYLINSNEAFPPMLLLSVAAIMLLFPYHQRRV